MISRLLGFMVMCFILYDSFYMQGAMAVDRKFMLMLALALVVYKGGQDE